MQCISENTHLTSSDMHMPHSPDLINAHVNSKVPKYPRDQQLFDSHLLFLIFCSQTRGVLLILTAIPLYSIPKFMASGLSDENAA
jgi:hypothetical protein